MKKVLERFPRMNIAITKSAAALEGVSRTCVVVSDVLEVFVLYDCDNVQKVITMWQGKGWGAILP